MEKSRDLAIVGQSRGSPLLVWEIGKLDFPDDPSPFQRSTSNKMAGKNVCEMNCAPDDVAKQRVELCKMGY
ncbi:hypothetical protein SLEP1_g3666 [Rubroshorea leprosula]|uniref:Uncharacterized protein n=1 Tax=Rubroshorea leprosula TaxID=152421 RepID=A0AAV5HS84_9ROSI|nr:hypothetical protein SLEP1_g3666 [Rubroshorea leprosula]